MKKQPAPSQPSAPHDASHAWLNLKVLVRGKISAARYWLASKLVRLLYRRPMHVSPFPGGTTAACALFWYFDNGTRKFLMVREKSENARARFLSVMEERNGRPLNENLLLAVQRTFGPVFFRALDTKLFGVDRVAAAPSFAMADKATGQNIPVLSLVWVMQITREQAQLCNAEARNIQTVTIPEYGLMGPEVADSHKGVYQSVLRHVHGKQTPDNAFMMEMLEELLQDGPTHKTVH